MPGGDAHGVLREETRRRPVTVWPTGFRRFIDRHPLDRNGRETLLLTAAAVALGLTALVVVAWVAGWHSVFLRARNPHPLWLPWAFAGVVASYFGYVLAYREVTRCTGGQRLLHRQIAMLVATGFTAFQPAGGFRFDAHMLRHLGVGRRRAALHPLALGALEYVVLAPAATAAAIVLIVSGVRDNGGVILSWIIGVPVGTVLALGALRHAHRFARHGRIGRAISQLLLGVAELRRLRESPAVLARALGGMALYWFGEIFALWACLMAFYQAGHPGTAAVIVGYATGYAATRRTLPLAGAGITDALLPFALSWVGVALAPAVLAVAAYRAFNLWLPLIPGVAGVRPLRRLKQEVAEAASADER